MKLRIVGEAPSRKGDGRPFSGSSGRRLAHLLGLDRPSGRGDYEALWSHPSIELHNLFPVPMPKEPGGRGDQYDRTLGRYNARFLLRNWRHESTHSPVLACGHRVFRSMTTQRGLMFKGRVVEGVPIWLFPHPSGASPFWNDSANVDRAARFLTALSKRYGITIIDR